MKNRNCTKKEQNKCVPSWITQVDLELGLGQRQACRVNGMDQRRNLTKCQRQNCSLGESY